MTWAVKEAASLAGSFLESEATFPRRISLTETFLYDNEQENNICKQKALLDVEANIVTGITLFKLFVVHFNRLDFSGDVCGSETHDHSSFDDTSLNPTNGHSSDTTNFVDILKRETERLVRGTDGRFDGIDGIKKGLALDNTSLGLLGPALVPWHAVQDTCVRISCKNRIVYKH